MSNERKIKLMMKYRAKGLGLGAALVRYNKFVKNLNKVLA